MNKIRPHKIVQHRVAPQASQRGPINFLQGPLLDFLNECMVVVIFENGNKKKKKREEKETLT